MKRIVVDGVDFAGVFQFPRILRSITTAMQPPRLAIALLMVVAIVGVGRVWDASTTPGVSPQGILAEEMPEGATPGAARGAFDATATQITDCLNRTVRGVVYLQPRGIYEAGADLLVRLPAALWNQERAFTIVFGLFVVLVIAVGGGALSRMAACEVAGYERLRVRDAFDFALENWLKLLFTPLLPALIAGGVALVLIVMGFLMAPWVDLLGGALYGLLILLGLLLVFLLFGYAVGFPLLIPAVACENCDPADAQQRAYAYVLNRPLHFLGYIVIGLIGLAFGYVVVALVATAVLNLTAGLVGVPIDNSALAGAGGFGIFELSPERPAAVHESWHNSGAAAMISFWQRLVVDLVFAYVLAYLFTCSTTIYLLMRKACDGQDIDEIWRSGLTPGTLVPGPPPFEPQAHGGASRAREEWSADKATDDR